MVYKAVLTLQMVLCNHYMTTKQMFKLNRIIDYQASGAESSENLDSELNNVFFFYIPAT